VAELADLPTGRQARTTQNNFMDYCVYAISSTKQKYIYVGLTKDLIDRFNRHNSGREKTTRSYRPFKIIYTELASDLGLAREREKYLKSGVGKEFLKTFN